MSITHTAHTPLAPRDSAPADGVAPSAMASALAHALGLAQGTAPKAAATATEGSTAPRESSPRDGRHANGPHGPRGSGPRPGNTRNGPRAAQGNRSTQGSRPARPERPARPTNPVLLKLAELYPALFGDVARPLKRGVFQDLMAAHPDVFEKAALKEALGQHTRSTRYLRAMSEGLPRHDLQGQPVEALAPEHTYHALLEVFKRRHARTGEDVRAPLQARMLQMLDASGLHRDDFAKSVRTKDEAANTLLDAVLAHANERAAKDEALHRAHASSALSVEDFANSYGMDTATVAQSLARAALVPQVAEDAAPADASAAQAD